MEKKAALQEQKNTPATRKEGEKQAARSVWTQQDWMTLQKGMLLLRQGGSLYEMPIDQIKTVSACMGNDAFLALMDEGNPFSTVDFVLPDLGEDLPDNSIRTTPPMLADTMGMMRESAAVPPVNALHLQEREQIAGGEAIVYEGGDFA